MSPEPIRRRLAHIVAAFAAAGGVALVAQGAPPQSAGTVTPAWQETVMKVTWVCYSPTHANPDQGVQPTRETLRADLATLRRAGFTGLVTYGSGGLAGREIVSLAEAAGFRGLIVGVWDPKSADELAAARTAAQSSIVLGCCVGNEGYPQRYSRKVLTAAMDELRQATGKPVTTTEEIDDYLMDDDLLTLGDWVFPNAHPFFHGRIGPATAVRWTEGAYDELYRQSGRFVWFKELGLPTGGDKDNRTSPAAQEEYYVALAKSPVMFAYFEAFDQPWKTWRPFEARWGLFTAAGEPKQLAERFLKDGPLPRPNLRPSRPAIAATTTKPAHPAPPFYVYRDAGAAENHYSPSGLDGDCGDVTVDEACPETPHSGPTCLKITYVTEGQGPHKCAYGPPCRWASLRWLHPAGNWGDEPNWAGKGFDLSPYTRVVFWARAAAPCRARFSVGGVDGPYGDSLAYPRTLRVELTTEWQRFELDLRGVDRHHIIAGFGWDTNWDVTPGGATVYLDDICFE